MKQLFLSKLVLISILVTMSGTCCGFLGSCPSPARTTRILGQNAPLAPKTADPNSNAMLIYGTSSGPLTLDPMWAWDSASEDLIDQVYEGLYQYNLTDPNLAPIPWLATNMGNWSADKMNFTVTIRPGITFQDGTPLDAAAVKWSFDRLQYLLNEYNNLSASVPQAQMYSDFQFLDGVWILNHTVVVSPMQIKFVLNEPYAPFITLLCFEPCYIMSPKSTPFGVYITPATDTELTGAITQSSANLTMVGTGPYIFTNYIPGVEVDFSAYSGYWGGPTNHNPQIPNLKFAIIVDQTARTQAVISGQASYIEDPLPSMYSILSASKNVTLTDYNGITGLTIRYIGFNCNQMNLTMREAMSYAFNYSYVINQIWQGNAAQMKGPIPPGIPYSNWTDNTPVFNLTKARDFLINGGVYTGLPDTDNASNDLAWVNLATTTPIAEYNFTWNLGNSIRESLGELCQQNFAQIGIKVDLTGMSWANYEERFANSSGYNSNMLQLYALGWQPDYNDPSNYIIPLFSPTSISDDSQVNDPILNANMSQLISTSDPATLQLLYNQIQQRVVEHIFPWIYTYMPLDYNAFVSNLRGFPGNGMGKVYFKDCYFINLINPPTDLSIKINGGAADTSNLSVALTLSATGATEMCFSNNGTTYTAWEAFNTSKAWMLDEIAGLRTVYFKARNDTIEAAAPATATITYTPPGIPGFPAIVLLAVVGLGTFSLLRRVRRPPRA